MHYVTHSTILPLLQTVRTASATHRLVKLNAKHSCEQLTTRVRLRWQCAGRHAGVVTTEPKHTVSCVGQLGWPCRQRYLTYIATGCRGQLAYWGESPLPVGGCTSDSATRHPSHNKYMLYPAYQHHTTYMYAGVQQHSNRNHWISCIGCGALSHDRTTMHACRCTPGEHKHYWQQRPVKAGCARQTPRQLTCNHTKQPQAVTQLLFSPSHNITHILYGCSMPHQSAHGVSEGHSTGCAPLDHF
jgi:hypothetical protein